MGHGERDQLCHSLHRKQCDSHPDPDTHRDADRDAYGHTVAVSLTFSVSLTLPDRDADTQGSRDCQSCADLGKFGNVKLGASKSKKVTLTNTAAKKGGATVTFSGGTISGSSAFMGATSCFGPVAPKGKCTVTVVFKPTVAGTQSATATINSNASNTTQFSIVGNGVAAKKKK